MVRRESKFRNRVSGAVMAAFCAVIFLGAEGKTAIAQVPAAENGGATSLIKESLQLRVGQSMFVNTPDRLRRVYVSNPDVLDSVTSNPHQIVVTAKTPGNATLILWDESGQSQAYQVAVNLDSDALRTALKNALPQDNVQVEVQRDQIALSGTVANQAAADEALDALAKRAADVFKTSVAVITTIDSDREYFVGQSGNLPSAITDDTGTLLPMDRQHAICNYVVANEETLVVPDIERDPRFADNSTIEQWNMRFYAGAPLRAADGLIIGALCVLDPEPRALEQNELALLETLAADVTATITPRDAQVEAPVKSPTEDASATVGQPIPP